MVAAVIFIIVFSLAALVPLVWAIVGSAQGRSGFWPVFVGAGWGVALLLVTIIGIATDWGGCDSDTESSKGAIRCLLANGEESSCKPDVWDLACNRPTPGCSLRRGDLCPRGQTAIFDFCEEIEPGSLMQPAATWSDICFIAAGLWVLWLLQRHAGASNPDNPMKEISVLSVAYGMIVIFMGPPSMWFHASMKDWGGWFDSLSVVSWLGFNAVYVIYSCAATMWDWGRNWVRQLIVMLGWAALIGVLAAVSWEEKDARLISYFITGGLWGLGEVVYLCLGACDCVKYKRNWRWFVGNISTLALTMGLWAIYNDDVSESVCDSVKGFPGHALFHILASVSTVLTYFSFESEEPA